MASVKITSVLDGVPRLIRALQLTDAGTRARTRLALQHGAERIARQAQARAPKVSGELAQSIFTDSTKDGMVWFIKAGHGKLLRSSRSARGKLGRYNKAKERQAAQRERFRAAKSSKQAQANLQLGVYAPVVERGDKKRNKPARPFLYPSLEHERSSIMRAVADAPIQAGRSQGL